MKALRYGIASLFVVGFAQIAACGGSTDGDVDATAGKSAGGAGPGAGGRSSGPGAAGGATNNPACPATAPADASACTPTRNQPGCNYSGTRCTCERMRGGGTFPGGTAGGSATANGEWQCTTMLVCPATKPAAGDACTPAAGNCRYSGMGSCSCSEQTSKWTCSGGGPIGGGGAPGVGGGFPGFGGGFPGIGGSFPGVGGAATTTNCPATKPTADTACTGTDACPYTGGGCQCISNKWSCL